VSSNPITAYGELFLPANESTPTPTPGLSASLTPSYTKYPALTQVGETSNTIANGALQEISIQLTGKYKIHFNISYFVDGIGQAVTVNFAVFIGSTPQTRLQTYTTHQPAFTFSVTDAMDGLLALTEGDVISIRVRGFIPAGVATFNIQAFVADFHVEFVE
jgi:hypothetical protein